MGNEIADEIRELRKAKEGQDPVYVDVDVKLQLEQAHVDILQGLLVQAAKQNELLAAQNDLLAQYILERRPQPLPWYLRYAGVVLFLAVVLVIVYDVVRMTQS